MKKILPGIVAALAVVYLQSCGGAGDASTSARDELSREQLDSIGRAYEPAIGTYGGTVRLSIGADPDGFSPATSQSAYSSEIMGLIYEGLVTTDPVTLEYIPHIAREWEVSDDGIEWTFYMRDDVTFSDGVPVTAHDVAFTFNDVIYNEKVRSGLNHNFRIQGKKIEVEALDSLTVRFTLPAPFAPFMTVAGMSIMPEHTLAEVVERGDLESYLSNGADPAHVIGSGPFILEKVELGQRIVLRRNPTYWKKDAEGNRLPYLERIVMQVIKEPNVAMMKFKNGELDHLVIEGEHYPILKPLEEEKGIEIYRVGPIWYDSFIVFNQNNQKDPKTGEWYLEPPKQNWFRNVNFRKACAHAVNYQAIIDIVYNGLARKPAGVWGPHKGFFHNPEATTYDYDPRKAKELLAAEGFVDRNGDGFLEDNEGNTVEFTLTSSSGVQRIATTFEMVTKDLKNIGLKVHLNLIEFNNMMDKLTNTYDWDAAAYSLGGIIDPHFGKSTVTSSSFRYVMNPKQETPSEPWEARIDSIFEVAVSVMDRDKRKALYDEWQSITMDKCLKVYLPLREVILGVNDRFGNIHLTPYLNLGRSLLHNIDEIYVKEER
jgi:peptide/nickel transport system substrate-binding protein